MHRLCLAVALLLVPALAPAADLVRLAPGTWDEFVPQGKEVDAIYGDYVLRNDRIVVVVAEPIEGRNANMTVRGVGGAIIDLTRRERQSDQLSAYYPEAKRVPLRFKSAAAGEREVTRPDARLSGERVVLVCQGEAAEGGAQVEVKYTLADGWDAVLIETTYTNPGQQPLTVELTDAVRADRSFERVPVAEDAWLGLYDKWWRQAYGALAEGRQVQTAADSSGARAGMLVHFAQNGSHQVTVPPQGSYTFARRVFPAADSLELKALAGRLREEELVPLRVVVKDTAGQPVPEAEIELSAGGKPYGHGWSDENGSLVAEIPAGEYELQASGQGREVVKATVDPRNARDCQVVLGEPGYVVAQITSEGGGPIPCKVQFRGLEGTPEPFFGPDTFEHVVHNLYYSHDGRFRQALAPGKYEVIVSYGPEYDAVFTQIEVERGKETKLGAKLVRSVQTPGWVSADFHSHSSPSGDNTSSQYGRVLNLLCEHVEFAPCTEHNRISTYVPHLKRLGVEHLMGTATGIELTGQPLPINHQNAFPLERKPRTQDGGGPQTDEEPEVQIERLALWDGGSEKLVQQNHPDLGSLFYDKNGDGRRDEGFKKSIPYIDAIEVHPLDTLFQPAVIDRNGRSENNRLVNWMQLLNQGYRIPGVVNTDAHYNFHGSGFIRNYIQSPTDDPGEIETIDIVRASERGNVILTTGPYLEVLLESGTGEGRSAGTAGEDVRVSDGQALLHVRVQCPNWFDIDRVQVLLNGRPAEGLNFTRFSTPERFTSGTVKFHQQLPLELKEDTHLIVAALAEKSTMGPVMGPTYGKLMPIAVSNPIWADVDGEGFRANGDTLGAPLPVKSGLIAQ